MTLLQDVRHGLRALRLQPGFAAVAILSLALGIGLNATMFTVLDELLFRPLPVRDPSSLAAVFTSTENRQLHGTTSYPDFVDLAAANSVFTDMVGHSMMFAAAKIAGDNRLVLGEVVTANFFSALGIVPSHGRGFTAEEGRVEGRDAVVVISHRLWERHFGRRDDVLAQTIVIRNRSYAIVGVAPPSFMGFLPGVAAELWIPVTMVGDVSPAGMNDVVPSDGGDTRLQQRGTRWLFVKGRLRDGVTIDAARSNLSAIMSRLAAAHPISNRDRRISVLPATSVRFHPMVDDILRPAGAVIMAAVALVLIIACANLASMLLARGAARTREMAVRSAIGATRGRLIRQLVAENLVLALAGGALALLLARWATSLILRTPMPIDLPISFTLSFDARVLVFTLVTSLVTGLTFGLLPAWRASRTELVPALRDDASLSGGRRFGLRQALVSLQVAVSVVLIVAGVLLTRSLFAASDIDPGFRARQLVVATIALEMHGYDAARARDFFPLASDRLRQLPGVDAVAVTERVPFSPNIQYSQIVVDGRPAATPEGGATIDAAIVTDTYFDTIGVPIVDGRAFDSRDTPESQRVAIVSEGFARRFFPGERAVGQRIRLRNQTGPVIEIVGVARDYDQRALGEAARPVLHTSRSQRPGSDGSFLVRTAGDPRTQVREIERTLRAIEPNLVFIEFGPLEELIATSLYPVSTGSKLLAGLSGLAIGLSGLGLYGVVAFSVARRTREIGIRVALGSSRRQVLQQVLGEAMTMVALGAAAGLALSTLAAPLLSSVLYGVSPADPVSYASAVLLVLATAALAAFLPARRAAAIDPIRALRVS